MFIPLPTPCVVVMAGASGAGKSTLAARLAATDPDTVVISYDRCREELCGDPHDQIFTPAAVQLAHDRLDRRCGWGLSTVVDGTHTTRHERVSVREIADRHGIPTALVVLTTPLGTCQARQTVRTHPVPRIVVTRQHLALADSLRALATSPAGFAAEGFATVHFTHPSGGAR
ncbi:ATP-binding protein [Actinokineospora inagensis]|uniref:ATP-binding protein n=1 Tax=Actinokineospora inagensis TaxID=103730 RepID=UPI0004187714|nr:ATP-binding protein [Actinokineospora inagensis]